MHFPFESIYVRRLCVYNLYEFCSVTRSRVCMSDNRLTLGKHAQWSKRGVVLWWIRIRMRLWQLLRMYEIFIKTVTILFFQILQYFPSFPGDTPYIRYCGGRCQNWQLPKVTRVKCDSCQRYQLSKMTNFNCH